MLLRALRKKLEIGKVQLKLVIWPNFLLASVLIMAGPFLFGIENLEYIGSSFVLERYVALIGIILFTPLIYPEEDPGIKELVESKKATLTEAYMIRIALATVGMIALIFGFVCMMQLNHCVFNPLMFIFGTIASAFFMGGLGFLAHVISNNIVIGYMVPIGVFMFNLFLKSSQLQNIYLFSLSENNIIPKYWLLGIGVLLFMGGFIFIRVRTKLR